MSAVRAAVAIVTGAGSGIGRAAALRLLADYDIVVGVDIDADGLDSTGALADGRGRFISHVADVSNDDQCAKTIDAATAVGTLGAIVNCAGVMPADDHVERLDPATWDRTFAVNVRPIFLLARYGLAAMRPGGGVIVNVTSVHAYASTPATSAYAASKGAIVALTQQLALDLAKDGVRVVAVAPGSVDTPMSLASAHRSGAATIEELGFPSSRRAIGRIAQPTEIAEAVAWLASPASGFVNGTTLRADGGLLAGIAATPPRDQT